MPSERKVATGQWLDRSGKSSNGWEQGGNGIRRVRREA